MRHPAYCPKAISVQKRHLSLSLISHEQSKLAAAGCRSVAGRRLAQLPIGRRSLAGRLPIHLAVDVDIVVVVIIVVVDVVAVIY